MSFELNHGHVWIAAILSVSAYALLRGGSAERLTSVANLIAWLSSSLLENRVEWFDPQWGILAVDVAFLIFLVALSLVRDRMWLLFAAAFQLLGVVTHFAILADPGVRSLAYLRSLAIWSYLVLATLGIGAWTAHRQVRPALA